MNKNPFNVLYGMIPNNLIKRTDSYDVIMSNFMDESIQAMTYLILGIRGSGKTVLLRSIAKSIKENKDWIVIDLNPQGDFVSPMAEALYLESKKNKIDFDWSIDFSLPNVTFHAKKDSNNLSPESGIRKLINSFALKNKKILLTIDEVNSTERIKYFFNFYQSLIGEGYPIFLLMTGLIENVDSLMNDKATSFLARSPKIYLDPLDLLSISKSYQKELNATSEESRELANLTKGYAFAYQVVGKICYDEQTCKITDNLLSKIDNYLNENGYSVIWKNMTEVEKKICIALEEENNSEASNIRTKLKMSVNNFNNYRGQMIRKGYLVALGYGKIDFALPRFKEYVNQIKYFY